jgi:hypothetical protein
MMIKADDRLTVNFLPFATHSNGTELRGKGREVHHKLESLHFPDNNSPEGLQILSGAHQQKPDHQQHFLPIP